MSVPSVSPIFTIVDPETLFNELPETEEKEEPIPLLSTMIPGVNWFEYLLPPSQLMPPAYDEWLVHVFRHK